MQLGVTVHYDDLETIDTELLLQINEDIQRKQKAAQALRKAY